MNPRDTVEIIDSFADPIKVQLNNYLERKTDECKPISIQSLKEKVAGGKSIVKKEVIIAIRTSFFALCINYKKEKYKDLPAYFESVKALFTDGLELVKIADRQKHEYFPTSKMPGILEKFIAECEAKKTYFSSHPEKPAYEIEYDGGEMPSAPGGIFAPPVSVKPIAPLAKENESKGLAQSCRKWGIFAAVAVTATVTVVSGVVYQNYFANKN